MKHRKCLQLREYGYFPDEIRTPHWQIGYWEHNEFHVVFSCKPKVELHDARDEIKRLIAEHPDLYR